MIFLDAANIIQSERLFVRLFEFLAAFQREKLEAQTNIELQLSKKNPRKTKFTWKVEKLYFLSFCSFFLEI